MKGRGVSYLCVGQRCRGSYWFGMTDIYRELNAFYLKISFRHRKRQGYNQLFTTTTGTCSQLCLGSPGVLVHGL